MSNGFIFGTDPLKFTTPVTVPAVAASTEIVAGLAAEEAEDGSEAGCDLAHPKSRISKTSAEQKKILPRINADEHGSEKCGKLVIQSIEFYGPPYPKVVALSAGIRVHQR
jgi:hypothetical protein